MPPPDPLPIAMQHHRAGRLPEAEALYRQILATQPNHPDALHLLGLIAHQTGHHETARALIERAIRLNPTDAEYHSNLGSVFHHLGRFADAAGSCRTAVEIRPAFAEAHYNLGNALAASHRTGEAIAAYRETIRLKPGHALAHSNLGDALQEQLEFESAAAAYRTALGLDPTYAPAHNNLGNALESLGQIEAASESYRTAAQLQPGAALHHNNLGTMLKDLGRLGEAIGSLRTAIALDPANSIFHSNLLFTLHYQSGLITADLLAEHLAWNARHAPPFRPFIRPHANSPDPARRLKIGYISPDLREHAVGRFLLPILENHDHTAHEIFCYADVPFPDALTPRFRQHADVWREIHGLTIGQIADLIRADGIDLLIDLTAHAAYNHLPVFACKPAPIQVTYLAYCSTTGLDTIDYRLSDPYLDPPDTDESLYSEKTLRLPQTYWCYQPHTTAPLPNPLPALTAGHITFGCLNNFCKVTSITLNLWSRLLRAIPDSRLLLHAHPGSQRQRVLDHFADDDITPERITFIGRVPTPDYFPLYHQIDIALDPFPFGGGTTTCDALWMGVPLISLTGQTPVSRAGLSLLTNAGLPDLVASTTEDYITIAENLANDLPRLSDLRQTLRPRMQASPLTNAPRFTQNLEATYRKMWQRWCATRRE